MTHQYFQDAAFKYELCSTFLREPFSLLPVRFCTLHQLHSHLPTIKYPADMCRDNIFERRDDPLQSTFHPGRCLLLLNSDTFYVDKILAHSVCWNGETMTVNVNWSKYTPFLVPRACDGLYRILCSVKIQNLRICCSREGETSTCVVRTLMQYFRHPQNSASCATIHLQRFESSVDLLFRCPHSTCLQHLIIEECVFDQNTFLKFVSAQKRLSSLKFINVNGFCSLWNFVGQCMSSNCSVTSVAFENCCLTAESMTIFADGLKNFLPRAHFAFSIEQERLPEGFPTVLNRAPSSFCTSLTELSFLGGSTNAFYEGLAEIMENLPQLKSLHWKGSKCQTAGAKKLLRAITESTRLWSEVGVDNIGDAFSVSALKRLTAMNLPSGSSFNFSNNNLRSSFCKIRAFSCVAQLRSLNLSFCGLTDECMGHLAAALDKVSIVPLENLYLESNLTVNYKKTGKGFLRLCKSLRGIRLPYLRQLGLQGNHLSGLPIGVLLDQLTNGVTVISLTLPPSAADLSVILSALIKRQKSRNAFKELDIIYDLTLVDDLPISRADFEFLKYQMSVRLLNQHVSDTRKWSSGFLSTLF